MGVDPSVEAAIQRRDVEGAAEAFLRREAGRGGNVLQTFSLISEFARGVNVPNLRTQSVRDVRALLIRHPHAAESAGPTVLAALHQGNDEAAADSFVR